MLHFLFADFILKLMMELHFTIQKNITDWALPVVKVHDHKKFSHYIYMFNFAF